MTPSGEDHRLYARVPGDQIGPYEVKRLLGHGCEGHVYLVTDIRDRSFKTLKLLRGRNMAREVEHIASHYHRLRAVPSVKQFIEWGILKRQAGVGDRPWLAFDYVDGATLYELVNSGRIACSLCVLMRVARALQPLHRRRIAIGDFDRGRNVLVERGTGRIVFCDLDAGEVGEPPLALEEDIGELARLALRLRRPGTDLHKSAARAIGQAGTLSQATRQLQMLSADGGCTRSKQCTSRSSAKSARRQT